MKKHIILVILFLVTGLLNAQQSVSYILRGRSLCNYGKYDEAVSVITDGINQSNDYRLYIERGEAYLGKGNLTEALNDFQKANELEKFSGEYGISRALARKGDIAGSLQHLEKNLGSKFKIGEKEIMLEPSYLKIENSPDWRQFWKKDLYSVIESKTSEIEYDISTGKLDDARQILSDIPLEGRNDPGYIYAKGIVDLESGRPEECISAMQKLLSADKGNEMYSRLLAKAQFASGNAAGASDVYTGLIDKGTADAELYILRARCYIKTGENEKSLKDIETYLSLYPDNSAALRLAGKTSISSGDNLKALDFFNRNIKMHPGDPECYLDRAGAYFVSGTWGNAVNDYNQALDIQPSNPETWINKGLALINEGKTEDACHDFHTALNLGSKKAATLISRYCIK